MDTCIVANAYQSGWSSSASAPFACAQCSSTSCAPTRGQPAWWTTWKSSVSAQSTTPKPQCAGANYSWRVTRPLAAATPPPRQSPATGSARWVSGASTSRCARGWWWRAPTVGACARQSATRLPSTCRTACSRRSAASGAAQNTCVGLTGSARGKCCPAPTTVGCWCAPPTCLHTAPSAPTSLYPAPTAGWAAAPVVCAWR
jgi:hypothetical protein